MYRKRTDLALETRELRAEKGQEDGIVITTRQAGGVKITAMEISPAGEEACGRTAGRYVTLEAGAVWRAEPEAFETAVSQLAKELRAMLPDGEGCVLVAGLGNREITADSLGPKVTDRLLVTRHIKLLEKELFASAGFGELAALASGVLGQTGMESAEIMAGVVKQIKPRCVIAIDALASRRLERLASTVQLSDTGIRPGSGVSNHRAAFNRETLGIPVISVGVPTVVDAGTLAFDLLEELADREGFSPDAATMEKIVEGLQCGTGKDFFVTPKDSDALTSGAARLISAAINLAVHEGMTQRELAEYQSGI